MINVLKKSVVSSVTLLSVVGLAYAAGAAEGKTPINVSAADQKWTELAPGSPLKMTTLWGDRNTGEYAMLLKLPAGFEAGMHAHTADYHAVTLQGTWVHTNEGGTPKELPVGSYV